MRIELNPRPSDGHDKQERTGWSHDPLQLSHRLEITVRINGISIAAETDVFDDVHAREGLHLAISERQAHEVSMPALEIR